MDPLYRDVVLLGEFAAVRTETAKQLLESMGARVCEHVTATTTAVFTQLEGGSVFGGISCQGIPIFNEEALLGVLATVADPQDDAVAREEFLDFAALDGTDPTRLGDALRDSDWEAFTPARDLPPLRALLTEIERDHGITPAHRFATERIRRRGTTLSRSRVHREEINSVALSRSGSHLATGDWGQGDAGTVQIWDVAAGQCVNVLDLIDGGLGWPDHGDSIQWSADGLHLGLAFRTNSIGVWDPFGTDLEPRAEADVTDGSPRPPSWALHPNGHSAYVTTATKDRLGVLGSLPPLRAGSVFWLPDHAEKPHDHLLSKGPLPERFRQTWGDRLNADWPVWSQDGQRLLCTSRSGTFVVDVATGDPLWCIESWFSVFSADERLVAYLHGRQLHFADASTGRETTEPFPCPDWSSDLSLSWGMLGATNRLAAVRGGEAPRPGVDIFDDGRSRYRLDVTPARRHGADDFGTWAWAPSGDRAAILTAAGEIEVWCLDGEPRWQRTLPTPDGTRGILWGIDDVVMAIGAKSLRFLRADTGEILGDHTFLEGADAPLPLPPEVVYDAFYGRIFPLDDDTWCLPIEPNAAIAPLDRRADVEARLAWIVDRRFAWPLRWGQFDLWPDAATAMAEISGSSPDFEVVSHATWD